MTCSFHVCPLIRKAAAPQILSLQLETLLTLTRNPMATLISEAGKLDLSPVIDESNIFQECGLQSIIRNKIFIESPSIHAWL